MCDLLYVHREYMYQALVAYLSYRCVLWTCLHADLARIFSMGWVDLCWKFCIDICLELQFTAFCLLWALIIDRSHCFLDLALSWKKHNKFQYSASTFSTVSISTTSEDKWWIESALMYISDRYLIRIHWWAQKYWTRSLQKEL